MIERFIVFFLFTLLSLEIFSATEVVPIDFIRDPSDDLLYRGRILGTEEARWFATNPNNPLDLSQLDPVETDIWKNKILHDLNPNVDKLPVMDNEEINFVGKINSHSGLLRFNGIPIKGNNKVYTFLVDKTLHTYLLRRNLLRKLGHIVSPMKHLSKIKVHFNSSSELLFFLKSEVVESTFGAAGRWVGFDVMDSIMEKISATYKRLVAEGKIDPKEVKEVRAWENEEVLRNTELPKSIELHDIIAMEPSEFDHYNPAVMIPPKSYTSRSIRSLLIPYALLDIQESINKVQWFVGREDNSHIILPNYSYGSLNATYSDAIWSMRRLLKLTKDDFKEVVEETAYPLEAQKLLYEKLISRRNSLIKLFKMDNELWDVNFKISHGDHLKKGRLLKKDWEGYGSRFAHGLPDSPFQDFQYYIFSKLQTEGITNLIAKANEELSLYDLTKARTKFHRKTFDKGLKEYLRTGILKPIPIGTWASPTLDFALMANRDLVIGNYLGTDNLVQLADTFGVSFAIGVHLGIENLPAGMAGFAKGGMSYLKTYSHLKPVRTLKATFKEPYKNIITPLLKSNLKKRLADIVRFGEGNEELEDEVRKEELEKLMNHLNKNLGVGESLIVSEKIVPTAKIGMKYGTGNFQFGIGAGVDFVQLKRLHFYRRDSKTIQVYDDLGHSRDFDISLSIDNFIPLIRFGVTNSKGKYRLKAHAVNIDTSEDNPNLFKNAQALYHLLETGSSELLEEMKRPRVVKGKFKDNYTKFSFLVWKARYLDGNNLLSVTDEKGKDYDFLNLTRETQRGVNYEAFVKDILNYYITKFIGDWDVSVGVERFKNPAHSIFGVSEGRQARFESRLKNNGEELSKNKKISDPFIGIRIKKEGWSKSTKKIRKELKKINKKYKKKLFSDETLRDSTKLRLFEININVNLYHKAIYNLMKLKRSDLLSFQRKYKIERRNTSSCRISNTRRKIKKASLKMKCGNLTPLVNLNQKCQELMKKKNAVKKGECLLELADSLERNLEWNDFLKVIGGKDNLYVYGMVSGFRKDSEVLMDPIRSSSIGIANGRFKEGAVTEIKVKLGIQNGEFDGKWIRENL